jgi:hypothetical protein
MATQDGNQRVWTHEGGWVVGYFSFLTNSKRSPNKQPPTHDTRTRPVAKQNLPRSDETARAIPSRLPMM